jgi:hypothetical protein
LKVYVKLYISKRAYNCHTFLGVSVTIFVSSPKNQVPRCFVEQDLNKIASLPHSVVHLYT